MAEIVAIVASVLGTAIEAGKCVVVPIKRYFRYLCCFNTNIQSLRDEAKKLDLEKDGLQMQVDEARDNGKVILPHVVDWLTISNEIQVKVRGMEIEISNVQSGCSAIKSRFSLSKRADKTTEAIQQLLVDHSKFDQIYVSPPPTSMEPVPLGPNYEFDSRKKIEEEIMTSLKDERINIIGLCGLGGVGKTTMAKRIMNRAREEHLFDEAVMVVVSQQKDLSQIQLECAELLGLKLEQQTLSARAHTLRGRLMGTKRILMVLDDIWSRLNLEDIGIPCQSGFTILFTSRNRDVLRAMDVQKVCDVSILSEREAWFLFKDKAGACVDDLNLVSIAEAVVKECGGLPVALVTVGRALKDKTSKYIWEDALRQLRASNPIGLSDVLKEVYNPLKLSYDFLDNPHAKSIFLLCSMFPEDCNISLEQLTSYGWGLRMFGGVGNLGEARNYVYALTDILKSRSLLLDGDRSNYVKMHDVIRDTAIFIASKEGHFNLNSSSILDLWIERPHSDCTWISLYPQERTVFLSGLIFQSLRLLLINNSREAKYQIRDQFFEETNGLNVLSISLFSSLPQTVQLLKHLRTLYLCECTSDSISVVGELSSLEILYCFRCDFQDLPTEIGKLNRLRLLEIRQCRDLKRIEPGALSQLVQLEELKIVWSFDKWDISSLRELESLSSLTCLEIEIRDSALAAEELCLSQRIGLYAISIGGISVRDWFTSRKGKRFENKLSLNLQRKFTPRKWIQTFIKNSEMLCLREYDSSNLDLARSQNIEWLELSDCRTGKALVSTSASINSRIDVFPFLKTLRLYEVSELEEICDGPIPQGSNSFKNLQKLVVSNSPALKHLWKSPIQNVSLCNLSSVEVSNCDSMHSLFSLAIAKEIPQLEQLEIRSCKMMEQVLCNEENGTDEQTSRRHITFAKLKTIWLQDLERLTTLCKGIENIEFPLLEEMNIHGCPDMKSFVCWSGNDPICQDGHHNDDSFNLFCNQKVAFGNLKRVELSGYEDITNIWCCQIPNSSFFNGLEKLRIDKFNKIRSLFSSSIAQSLVNLKSLEISDCEEIIQVIAGDELKECEDQSPLIVVFPNLEELYLYRLPKLESFCEWRLSALQLPSLQFLKIDKCFHMERWTGNDPTSQDEHHNDDSFHLFCNRKVAFGNLKRVELSGYEYVTNVWCRQIPNSFFNGLERLEIHKLNKIRSLFPSSIAPSLVNLKRLRIRECEEMIQVIAGDECEDDQSPLIVVLPNLEYLTLEDLPKLESFCEWRLSALQLPSLQFVKIDQCFHIERWSGNDPTSEDEHHNDDSFHLFCNQKVAFGKLRYLDVSGYEDVTNIWCSQIPNSFFNGLETLDICKLNKIRSLFLSSIAPSLVNLKYLKISDCEEMIQVIAEDELKECDDQSPIVVFPNLEELYLEDLPKLESFCEWRRSFALLQLPSLEEVTIKKCFHMECFSLGSVTTPNLERIQIDDDDDDDDQ